MDASVSQTVTIDCPRCDGQGSQNHWHPDRGVCYRCRGRGTVEINVEKHKAVLRCLRAKYRSLRAEVRKLAHPHEDNVVVVALRYCEQDGRRVRDDLEAAGELGA